jgi:hypothetical protein
MLGTKIWLSQELRDDLERFARSRTLAARLVQRAQIVLMAAARKSDQEIAQAVGVVRQTVGLWRSRFVEHGIAGIEKDAPGGRVRSLPPALMRSSASPPNRLRSPPPTGAIVL